MTASVHSNTTRSVGSRPRGGHIFRSTYSPPPVRWAPASLSRFKYTVMLMQRWKPSASTSAPHSDSCWDSYELQIYCSSQQEQVEEIILLCWWLCSLHLVLFLISTSLPVNQAAINTLAATEGRGRRMFEELFTVRTTQTDACWIEYESKT